MDAFSYIANADVSAIEHLYQQYKNDSESVDESWQHFFKGFDFSQTEYGNEKEKVVNESLNGIHPSHSLKEVQVYQLIRAYRARGHLRSKTNPVRTRKDRAPYLDLGIFWFNKRRPYNRI